MEEISHPSGSAEGLTQASVDERTVYEVGFHILSTTPESEVGSAVDMIRAALAGAQAEIISERAPARMTLAYPIERSLSGKREKSTESYFGAIKFATQPGLVPGIMDVLRRAHTILRFIIVETTREEVPSPRRALFTSRSLEGKTIEKPIAVVEKSVEVSEGDLDKSIAALIS